MPKKRKGGETSENVRSLLKNVSSSIPAPPAAGNLPTGYEFLEIDFFVFQWKIIFH